MDDKEKKIRQLTKLGGQLEAELDQCREENEQLRVENKDRGLKIEEMTLLEDAYEKKLGAMQGTIHQYEKKTGNYMLFVHVLMATLGLLALPLIFFSVVGWSGLFAFLTGLMIYFVLIVINHTFTADIHRQM